MAETLMNGLRWVFLSTEEYSEYKVGEAKQKISSIKHGFEREKSTAEYQIRIKVAELKRESKKPHVPLQELKDRAKLIKQHRKELKIFNNAVLKCTQSLGQLSRVRSNQKLADCMKELIGVVRYINGTTFTKEIEKDLEQYQEEMDKLSQMGDDLNLAIDGAEEPDVELDEEEDLLIQQIMDERDMQMVSGLDDIGPPPGSRSKSPSVRLSSSIRLSGNEDQEREVKEEQKVKHKISSKSNHVKRKSRASSSLQPSSIQPSSSKEVSSHEYRLDDCPPFFNQQTEEEES